MFAAVATLPIHPPQPPDHPTSATSHPNPPPPPPLASPQQLTPQPLTPSSSATAPSQDPLSSRPDFTSPDSCRRLPSATHTARYNVYCHYCDRCFTHRAHRSPWGQLISFRRCAYSNCRHELNYSHNCCNASPISFPVKYGERWWRCWRCDKEWRWGVEACVPCSQSIRGGEDLVFWKIIVVERGWRAGIGRG